MVRRVKQIPLAECDSPIDSIMTHIRAHFRGHAINELWMDGKRMFIARQLGTALGYRNEGKRFVTKITKEWSCELVTPKHAIMATGKMLDDIRNALGPGQGPSKDIHKLLLLTETGAWIALQKTSKRAGVELRKQLALKVLPEIDRTGSYIPPKKRGPAKNFSDQDDVRMLRNQRLDRESREKSIRWILTYCGEILSDNAKLTLVNALSELALGKPLPQETPAQSPWPARQTNDEYDWTCSKMARALGSSFARIGQVTRKLGIRNDPRYMRMIVVKTDNSANAARAYNDEAFEMIREELKRIKAIP